MYNKIEDNSLFITLINIWRDAVRERGKEVSLEAEEDACAKIIISLEKRITTILVMDFFQNYEPECILMAIDYIRRMHSGLCYRIREDIIKTLGNHMRDLSVQYMDSKTKEIENRFNITRGVIQSLNKKY